MAEIVTKLDPNLLLPCVSKLLDALIVCFGDESWPVRDAACVALGSLISTFPNETRAAGYDNLMATQFLRNLSDSIPSVRDGAAKSIAAILKSVGDQSLFQVIFSVSIFCVHILMFECSVIPVSIMSAKC